MADSPISPTPYEVLGVSATAPQEELRRAYRRLLRQTHPDTGGDPARFVAVQEAWERVGTPDDRAAYDRSGRGAGPRDDASWAPRPAQSRADTRPRARSHGHPGGWRRERYLVLMREWVGRGEPLEDPYDAGLVRSAPREIRHILADALAEEATARSLSTLGIGYTIWHDVDTGNPEEKIDHIVLGPTGLFAMLSEDFGAPVTIRRGELAGETIGDGRPMHDLGARAKVIVRATRVKFTALVIVVPDDELGEAVVQLGSIRGSAALVVRHSALLALLRDGVPGTRVVGGNELFDVRTRLQSAIRFV
ncbi:MAG TPA: DnaJ domain-containing protein [Lacisediminihabitans sp.]|uniref:DnaJ domain-containing protein n=1 Tax=Lacisediminihabitans sp. TaxID=2787631 RepID=UPI002ED90405